MVSCIHFNCYSCVAHGSPLYHDLQSTGRWWKVEVREGDAWADPMGEEMIEPSRHDAEVSAKMLLTDGHAVEVRILEIVSSTFRLTT